MPRRKQDETTPTATAESPSGSGAAEATATITTEEPPFEPTGTYRPTEEEQVAARRDGRDRFRSWVTAAQHGFSKLTDDERQRLVLLFDEKPADEVIAAMKGAGFQYHPDYHGHKHAWTRRNDYEGRLLVEALEKLIRSADAAVEPPAR